MGRRDSVVGQFGETARSTTRGRGLLCFSTTEFNLSHMLQYSRLTGVHRSSVF